MVNDAQSKWQIALHSLSAIILTGSIVAQIIGINTNTLNKYTTALTPPDVTFQIWIIIYLLTAALIVWQFFNNIYRSKRLDYSINSLVMAAFILGGAWPYTFEPDSLSPQFFIMIFYFIIITSASILARYSPVHPFVRVVLDIHTSWILFAVTLSGFCYIKYSFWMPVEPSDTSFSIDQLHEAAYSLTLMFIVILQGCLSVICASFAFGLVSIWTCSWLTIELFKAYSSFDMPSLKFSAGSGILISVGMTVLGAFLFDNNIYKQRNQSARSNNNDDSHVSRTTNEATNPIASQSSNNLISKKLHQENQMPAIIETPSVPNSELSVLA